jgi:hypothetical protein
MSTRTRSTIRSMRRHWPASVALLALGISAGGTAYASGALLPPASVGSVQLKPRAVTAPKLAANAITAKAVKPGTLRRADFKAGQLPSGTPVPPARAALRAASAPLAPQGQRDRSARQGAQGRRGQPGRPARRVTRGHKDLARCPATRSCTSTASRWTKPSRRSPSRVRRTRSSSVAVRPRAQT